jgi:hypothetical protein
VAIIYPAELRPSKLELVGRWLPAQPWHPAETSADLEAVGSYRFDDPAGEVGVEAHLVRAGDVLLHVPLTYRGEALPGAEKWLLGAMEHSVLGRRWVYDGCGDPVYVTALAEVILGGGVQAEEDVQGADGPTRRELGTRVTGGERSGPVPPVRTTAELSVESDEGRTTIGIEGLVLVVRRVLDPITDQRDPTTGPALTGTWTGQEAPVVLATALPA